jgi:hypothetical protein
LNTIQINKMGRLILSENGDLEFSDWDIEQRHPVLLIDVVREEICGFSVDFWSKCRTTRDAVTDRRRGYKKWRHVRMNNCRIKGLDGG